MQINSINKLLQRQSITRRGFMAGVSALGMASYALSNANSPANAAQPKRGGHLRAGLIGGSTTDTMDPATFNDTFMISLSNSVRDHLVDVGYGNSLQPALAESWEASPDAKTWRFKLRQGVEFSNAKPLTAEDVIASINLHRGPETKSGASGLFKSVTNVTSDGQNVVVVELEGGNADFPYILTDYHVPIVPSADGKADALSTVGTGLYTLENFEPGVRAQFKRHPNAWQQDSLGFFDEATIVGIADVTARQNAMLGGEVHVMNRPDLKLVSQLANTPGVRVESVTSNLHYTAPMFMDFEPFKNADFRTAMKHALNRQEFVDKILVGFGTIGNDHPIGPGFRFHDASIEQNAFDLDKARYHIKKSGLQNIKVDFSAADAAYLGAVDAALLLAESAGKVGININVVREPNDGYWSNIWLKKPWCAVYWGSRPVEDMILSIAYLSNAEWNDSHIRIEQLDQLIKSARAELDDAKRKTQYSDIQRIISQQGGSLVPAFAKDVMLIADSVQTPGQYGGGWEMDGGHFIKRWWSA